MLLLQPPSWQPDNDGCKDSAVLAGKCLSDSMDKVLTWLRSEVEGAKIPFAILNHRNSRGEKTMQQKYENLHLLEHVELWAGYCWCLLGTGTSMNYGCAVLGMLEETGAFLAKVAHSEEKLTWNNSEGPAVDKLSRQHTLGQSWGYSAAGDQVWRCCVCLEHSWAAPWFDITLLKHTFDAAVCVAQLHYC